MKKIRKGKNERLNLLLNTEHLLVFLKKIEMLTTWKNIKKKLYENDKNKSNYSATLANSLTS